MQPNPNPRVGNILDIERLCVFEIGFGIETLSWHLVIVLFQKEDPLIVMIFITNNMLKRQFLGRVTKSKSDFVNVNNTALIITSQQ